MSNEVPSPLNPPVYSSLKDLHLTTDLICNGRPAVTIIAPQDGSYDSQVVQVQDTIRQLSAVKVPIATDTSDAGKIPFDTNIIVLGNRSTNATISNLYNLFYTLLDLKYPGTGGYVVRTLHNPFGDGENVVFLGGSDTAGVTAATEAFCGKLSALPKDTDCLQIGRIADIKLGDGLTVPDDIRDVETWEASPLYQSKGYFTWNTISKHMAMYYMTGDESHAREVIRLSFPDEVAKQQITEIDDELIENKDDPLAGPYHYGGLMLILFWDLIEESPVFSDEERLRVTNAFSRQLAHFQERGWRKEVYDRYGQGSEAFAEPPEYLGNRHATWSYVQLYALSRYFQKDYPHPLWQHCIDGAKWAFSSLHQHCWTNKLFGSMKEWYSSWVAPILTYILLTGDRGALDSGALDQLLLGQEILISGQQADLARRAKGHWYTDPALASASIDYLHKAVYLTGDGRFLEYLRRTEPDTDVFRLGQSFWPEPSIQPLQPVDLTGKWTMMPMPEQMWRARANGFELSESFQAGSFRNSTEPFGDYISFNTFMELDRYHAFEIYTLQINGQKILERGNNFAIVRMGGVLPPKISQDSAIRRAYVLGKIAFLQAQTAQAGYGDWQRTILLVDRSYALIVDRVTFGESSEAAEVEIFWQGPGQWSELPGEKTIRTEHQDCIYDISCCSDFDEATVEMHGKGWNWGRGRATWRGPARKGETKTFLSLIAPGDDKSPVAWRRLDGQTASLQMPNPALITIDGYENISGELVMLTENHLHGKAVRKIDASGLILQAETPVDCDWDLEKGVLEVSAVQDTQIYCALAKSDKLTMDDVHIADVTIKDSMALLKIPAGKHTIGRAKPAPQAKKALCEHLHAQHKAAAESPKRQAPASVPTLPTFAAVDAQASVVAMAVVPGPDGDKVCAAGSNHVHVWEPSSEKLQVFNTNSPVKVMHYWAEHGLLLVGCENADVIAFDLQTNLRKWTFESKMDPAVYKAGKTYWYNTHRGQNGIHGLHTGIFYNGQTQAFIGSACTLEILDSNGKLMRRLPTFWGPGNEFALVDAPDGTINLLVCRRKADTHAAIVVNNTHEFVPNMLGPDPDSFNDVPPGHTDISIWGGMTRNRIFYDDIDGDGKKEVISDIDGAWNRISIWSNDAKPLYNANIGPGLTTYFKIRNMRGLELAKLDNSGKKAILTATIRGWVLALDCQCRTIWARHLAGIPVMLKTYAAGENIRIVIACEDGEVHVLNRLGDLVSKAKVPSKPACMESCEQGVVIGTDGGELEVIEIN